MEIGYEKEHKDVRETKERAPLRGPTSRPAGRPVVRPRIGGNAAPRGRPPVHHSEHSYPTHHRAHLVESVKKVSPPSYAGQRVGIFIDVQNMYYSARNLYDKRVNFEGILKEAKKDRILIRALAYVIKAESAAEQTFFDALERIGYEVKSKDLQIFYGGAKKGDWDIGIAMDMIELAPKLDVAVLVSGDGDFIPLVQHLQKAMGCKVEVMAFGRSASGKLQEAADVFTDIDKESRKFLQ